MQSLKDRTADDAIRVPSRESEPPLPGYVRFALMAEASVGKFCAEAPTKVRNTY